MKKLTLILALFSLSLQQTQAQDFFFPVQLPESISTIDTFHVTHLELYNAFKKHTDIAFPPIVIEKEGYVTLYLSMVICTMTHEPYFTMIMPFNFNIPLDYIILFFRNKDGIHTATFEQDFLKKERKSKAHLSWAFSLADKLIPKESLIFYICFFDHDTALSYLKATPYTGTELSLIFLPNAGSKFSSVCYTKTLQEKDIQTLKQAIQIYEDYIEINGIDNQFVRR